MLDSQYLCIFTFEQALKILFLYHIVLKECFVWNKEDIVATTPVSNKINAQLKWEYVFKLYQVSFNSKPQAFYTAKCMFSLNTTNGNVIFGHWVLVIVSEKIITGYSTVYSLWGFPVNTGSELAGNKDSLHSQGKLYPCLYTDTNQCKWQRSTAVNK